MPKVRYDFKNEIYRSSFIGSVEEDSLLFFIDYFVQFWSQLAQKGHSRNRKDPEKSNEND